MPTFDQLLQHEERVDQDAQGKMRGLTKRAWEARARESARALLKETDKKKAEKRSQRMHAEQLNAKYAK